MKRNTKTYQMTVLRSTTSTKDPESAYANLVLAGTDELDTMLVCGAGFRLSNPSHYQQMRSITQMSDCRMVFDQLAEIKATFRVIARPSKEESTHDMFQTMEALAIGINNSFVVLPGDDNSIKTEIEALQMLADLEKNGRL